MTDKTSKPAESLEPEAQPLYNGNPDRAIQLSQAISLKRLADAAEDIREEIALLPGQFALNGEISE